MHTRPDPRYDTAGRSPRAPAAVPVMPGEWYDPVRPPTISKPIAWAAIVAVSAVTATLLTLTSSAAQTAPRGSPRAIPVAESSPTDSAVIAFDFERGGGARPLAGWSGAGTASLTVDDTVAYRGERSLRVRPDGPHDRRHVEARVALGEALGDRSVRGARMSCWLRPGAAREVPGVRAGLVIEDGATSADFGAEVPLRAAEDEWVELSLTVGDRGEPGADGSTVYQSPQFDDADVASLAVYVEAPDGGLSSAVHVDACVIDTTRQTPAARAAAVGPAAPGHGDDDVYVPSLPPIPAPAPPAPGPATDEGEPDERAGGEPDGDPVVEEPSPPGGVLLLHDFEDPADALDDVSVDGAAVLSIDDTTASSGRRSLRIAPDPAGDRTSVETRIALDGRVPPGSLDGARIACRARADTDVAALGASGALIVEDARGGQDHGAQVTLRDGGRWTELTLVVGARDESARGGGNVPQSEGFDAGALTALRVRVDADGPLTAPINLDHCTITVT